MRPSKVVATEIPSCCVTSTINMTVTSIYKSGEPIPPKMWDDWNHRNWSCWETKFQFSIQVCTANIRPCLVIMMYAILFLLDQYLPFSLFCRKERCGDSIETLIISALTQIVEQAWMVYCSANNIERLGVRLSEKKRQDYLLCSVPHNDKLQTFWSNTCMIMYNVHAGYFKSYSWHELWNSWFSNSNS